LFLGDLPRVADLAIQRHEHAADIRNDRLHLDDQQ
jgi:hypothetical protein